MQWFVAVVYFVLCLNTQPLDGRGKSRFAQINVYTVVVCSFYCDSFPKIVKIIKTSLHFLNLTAWKPVIFLLIFIINVLKQHNLS